MTPSLAQQNMLPALAHELRQPLGAIEAIAYYMTLVSPGDSRQREQLARIQRLVEHANWILGSSIALADGRASAPIAVDLEELIVQSVSTRANAADPPFQFSFAPDVPLVHLDPGFGRAMVETLMGLFRQIASDEHPVVVGMRAAETGVELQVSSTAPNYRSRSGMPPGSAMAFDCVRRIAEMHGGSAEWTIDPLSGIQARVMLP